MVNRMQHRSRTLSLKMSDEEVLQAHALADHGDESVGRYVRRLIAREYARLFGDAPPPTVQTRMGRPRKTPAPAPQGGAS
jgi:hypothetical protein